MKLKTVWTWFVMISCLLFIFFVAWSLAWGPLSECPFHDKDPNTGECIVTVTVITEQDVNNE